MKHDFNRKPMQTLWALRPVDVGKLFVVTPTRRSVVAQSIPMNGLVVRVRALSEQGGWRLAEVAPAHQPGLVMRVKQRDYTWKQAPFLELSAPPSPLARAPLLFNTPDRASRDVTPCLPMVQVDPVQALQKQAVALDADIVTQSEPSEWTDECYKVADTCKRLRCTHADAIKSTILLHHRVVADLQRRDYTRGFMRAELTHTALGAPPDLTCGSESQCHLQHALSEYRGYSYAAWVTDVMEAKETLSKSQIADTMTTWGSAMLYEAAFEALSRAGGPTAVVTHGLVERFKLDPSDVGSSALNLYGRLHNSLWPAFSRHYARFAYVVAASLLSSRFWNTHGGISLTQCLAIIKCMLPGESGLSAQTATTNKRGLALAYMLARHAEAEQDGAFRRQLLSYFKKHAHPDQKNNELLGAVHVNGARVRDIPLRKFESVGKLVDGIVTLDYVKCALTDDAAAAVAQLTRALPAK